MRVLIAVALLAAVAAVAVGAFVMLSSKGEPASTRLLGVSVAGNGLTVRDLPGNGHELRLGIVVTSVRDIDACLAFALDEPFAGRTLHAVGVTGSCVRPRRGNFASTLVMSVTDDDTVFTSHTLLWGLSGGQCGLMTIFGVCAIDTAGQFPVNLPSKTRLPTFAPFKTFGPLFSFAPLDP